MLIKSFLSADRILPPKGKVLLEALFAETYDPFGSIVVPVEYQRRYPHLALVLRGGREEGLCPGDMVILEDEGVEVDRTYYDVFKLILNDDGKELIIVVDNDLEPVLREKMLKYRANRATCDVQISVQDINDDTWWTFNCSDVVDWTYDFQANKAHRYEYVPTYMIEVMDSKSGRFKLLYIADVNIVMAKLGEEDGNDRTGPNQD